MGNKSEHLASTRILNFDITSNVSVLFLSLKLDRYGLQNFFHFVLRSSFGILTNSLTFLRYIDENINQFAIDIVIVATLFDFLHEFEISQ